MYPSVATMLTRARCPAPTVKHSPFAGHDSWASQATAGATLRGASHSPNASLHGNGPMPVPGRVLANGVITLATMPSAAPSAAMERVRPMTPIFAMPYTAPPASPHADPDDTFTNRPPPADAMARHA